jgi:copper(I)-binding protein
VNANPPSARHRTRRPGGRLLVATAALLATGAVSSCSFGTTNFDAQTNQNYNPGEGALDRDGTVDVLNALVVSETDGTGRLIVGLANNDNAQDDALIGVSGPAIEVSGPSETPIPAGGFVQLADADASEAILVTGDEVDAGGHVEVTFEFEHADPVTVDVTVVPKEDDFADVEIPEATG